MSQAFQKFFQDQDFFFQISKQFEATNNTVKKRESQNLQDEEICKNDFLNVKSSDFLELNDESVFQSRDLFKNHEESKEVQEFKITQGSQFFLDNIDVPPNSNQTNIQNSPVQVVIPQYKQVFQKKKLVQKNGNVVRLLVDIAVSYFAKEKQFLPLSFREKIIQYCKDLKKWHLQDKKNVYNLEDLRNILQGQFQQINQEDSKILRKVFQKIIKNHIIDSMKKPRSQIRNKVHYLRVAKVYQLRCRNKYLIQRLQSK